MNPIETYRQSREVLFAQYQIVAESKTVATKGPVKNVHYLELGEGKPLILVHGGLSHSSEWVTILSQLANHFHLYVIDRPGCGLTDGIDYTGVDYQQSAVDFIGSFMDAVGLDNASFLAQSMGGYFAISFALQHSQKVEKLGLIGAPAGMNRWIPFPLRLLSVKGLNRFLFKTIGKPSVSNAKNVHQQLLIVKANKLADEYFLHAYHSQILPGAQQGALSMLENVLTLRGWRKELYLGDQLHRLTMPVRFIWGDQDAFEKPESGQPKTTGIKDCQFEIVKNAGHCPWLDQPERCAELVIAMLGDGTA